MDIGPKLLANSLPFCYSSGMAALTDANNMKCLPLQLPSNWLEKFKIERKRELSSGSPGQAVEWKKHSGSTRSKLAR